MGRAERRTTRFTSAFCFCTGVAGNVDRLKGAVIDCRNDHRIAMSFAVLGENIAMSIFCACSGNIPTKGLRVNGLVVDDKLCVGKTYPEFWEHCHQVEKGEEARRME